MKKMFEKKWLLLCLALIVVAAIVIGICVGAGNGEKDPNPSEGTSGVVTDPTGTTGGNGNEVTDPSDPSNTDDPSDVTEPTDDPDAPIGDYDPDAPPTPIDPDEPPVVDPDPDLTEPTEPDDDNDDDGDEVVPTVPDDEPIETRPTDTEYDFAGVTPGNMTAAEWKSWDADKRQAFYDVWGPKFGTLTLDEKYNFYIATQFNGYSCGYEGHHCAAQEHHDQVMAEMELGCPHCGSNDCDAFYARNEMGMTQIDFSKCPQYDVTKDPVYYCQVCGLPQNGESGEKVCITFVTDTDCFICGEPVKADECHECIKP